MNEAIRDAIEDLDVLQHWLPTLESSDTRIGLEQDYAQDLRELLIQNHPHTNQYIDWFDTYEHYEGYK